MSATTHETMRADARLAMATIELRLRSAGIPYHDLSVFGVIRCNVHVRCVSRETARRWEHLLAQAFKCKVQCVDTRWNAAQNKGTSLRPTMVRGFLIGCAF